MKSLTLKLLCAVLAMTLLLAGCQFTAEPDKLEETPAPEAVSEAPAETPADTVTVYNDGVYDGTAQVDEPDYSYLATATVTVENGLISDIQVSCDSPENELYMRNALNGMGAAMIESQSVEVDIKSGATASSDALIAAVADALSKAGTTEAPALAESAQPVEEAPEQPAEEEVSQAPAGAEADGSVEILGSVYWYGSSPQLIIDGETVDSEEIFGSGIYYCCSSPLTGYVYGTSDISFADYYYGELNDVEAADEIDIQADDLVSPYRDSGMYDAVTSATNNKWKQNSAYYTQAIDGGGGEILGVASVSVEVDASVYAMASMLSAAGVIDAGESGIIAKCAALTLSDDQSAPAQYKTLYANGVYSAMNSDACDVSTLTYTSASITNQSRYGTHQINLSSGSGSGKSSGATVIGVILETEDGAKYGLKQLENIWQNGRELAISTRVSRFEDMTGKTIVKITFITQNQQNYTMDVSLTVE